MFADFRFPREVISVAVRYGLSYRDVEELLAEGGGTVDHVSIYRWVQGFTPEFAEAARPCRHALREGGRSVGLPVPGYQPAWSGRRRPADHAA
jgi:transposase-like protein